MGTVLAAYVLFLIRDALILIFIAILLATAIDPIVERLRLLTGRGQAILIIYMAIALALTGFGYLLSKALLEETATLATNLPSVLGTLRGYAAAANIPFISPLLIELLDQGVSTIPSGNGAAATGVAQGVLHATVSIATVGFGFFTVLVIAYYWIVERAAVLRLFVSFFPPAQRSVARSIWQEIDLRLGGWVRGQLALMGIIAVVFAIGLSAMGVRYALLLAVFAGLVEIIPILGPWIGTAPAVLIALTQNVWLAVAVVVYRVVVQVVEGNVLVPRILGGSTGVSPLTVIIALLIGASLMGISGALLAVPVATALHVVIHSLVIEPASLKERESPAALQPLSGDSPCWLDWLRAQKKD